jgi:hypothetical protein
MAKRGTTRAIACARTYDWLGRQSNILGKLQFRDRPTAVPIVVAVAKRANVEPKAAAATRTTSWSTCKRLALNARTGLSLLRLAREGGGGQGVLVVRDSAENVDNHDNNVGTTKATAATVAASSPSLATGLFARPDGLDRTNSGGRGKFDSGILGRQRDRPIDRDLCARPTDRGRCGICP